MYLPLLKSIIFFSDRIFIRLLKNASWLVSGNAIAAFLGLINIALTARILGVETFGIFALITTYVAILDRLVNFQIWQALIKYGSAAILENNQIRLRQLIKFCVFLDAGSAIAGAIIGMLAAPIVAHYLNFNANQTNLLLIFNIITLSHVTGVPTAILRLYNKYRSLAFQNVFSSAIALLGLACVWLGEGALSHVLMVYGISQIAGNIYLILNGRQALRAEGLAHIWSVSLQDVRVINPDILKFIFFTNVESSVRVIRQLDIFIIKLILSVEAVSIYRIARRLADTMSTAIDPFFHAIYPELAKFFVEKNRRKFDILMIQSSVLVTGFSLCVFIGFIVFGRYFINLAFGEEFSQVYPIAIICILGMVVWAASHPLSPALYAMGQVKTAYYIHLFTALIYITTLYFMILEWQIVGAAIAPIIFFLTWALAAGFAYLRYRELDERSCVK